MAEGMLEAPQPTRPQLIPDAYAHVAARATVSSC